MSGPKHSLASVASYTPVLAAWRRFAEARTVPFLASSSSTAFPSSSILYSPPAGLVPEAGGCRGPPSPPGIRGLCRVSYRVGGEKIFGVGTVLVVRYLLGRFLSVRCSTRSRKQVLIGLCGGSTVPATGSVRMHIGARSCQQGRAASAAAVRCQRRVRAAEAARV